MDKLLRFYTLNAVGLSRLYPSSHVEKLALWQPPGALLHSKQEVTSSVKPSLGMTAVVDILSRPHYNAGAHHVL